MSFLAIDRVLAADIGGSFIKMAAISGVRSPIGKMITRPTPVNDIEALFTTIEQMVRELTDQVSPSAPLVLAMAGLVDSATGAVAAANIPCLADHHLRRLLSPRLSRPVVIINDADAFALAEATVGSGRGHRVVFGAVIGTGIGGGLVVDGRAVRGPKGIAGEWGHGPIALTRSDVLGRDIPRMECGCGRKGCADTFGGARGLERLHTLIGHARTDSHSIISGWRKGENNACETVDLWAEMLCEPLALTINVTGASIVPVGGGLGALPDLIEMLDSQVRKRTLLQSDTPVVVSSALGDQAGILGASILGKQVAGQLRARPEGVD